MKTILSHYDNVLPKLYVAEITYRFEINHNQVVNDKTLEIVLHKDVLQGKICTLGLTTECIIVSIT